jgi:hypothetical protein
MKRMLLAAGLALSALFAGCANQPIKIPAPQQLVAAFCPVVNADLKVLSASPLLSADQQALVSKILTVNTAVCYAGGQVDVSDLQTLNATLFPALITLVSSIPAIPNQPAILLGLTLAQPILAQVVAQLPVATAPAASSTPLAGAPLK